MFNVKNYFLLFDQKSFVHQSEHYNFLFLQSEDNILYLVHCASSSNDKTKSVFTP